MWAKLKEVWWVIALVGSAVFGVAGFVGHLYVKSLVESAVATELAKVNVASDPKITQMDKDLDAVKLTGQRNKEDIDDLEQRVRDAWNAFLGGQ